MAKTVDVPQELREYNKIFDRIAYRWGYDRVFEDFLDYAIACFLDTGNPSLGVKLEEKYGKDFGLFKELFRTWIMAQSKMVVEETDWYDGLGNFYESIQSSGKASALGQFFTPVPIVNFMVDILGDEYTKGAGMRMNEPASGSGRMCIAFHAHYPGNYVFAADLDGICTKMTALNMCIHGCEGQAVCMNALNADDWRFGYAVNPYIKVAKGVPHLVRIEKEQCVQWRDWQRHKAQWAEEQEANKQREQEEAIRAEEAKKFAAVTVKADPVVGKKGQLSFL